MKHSIKPFLTLAFLPLLMMISCQDVPLEDQTPPYETEGTLINLDYRLCACCGGVFIEIEGDTLRSQVWPEGFNYDPSNESFPIDVELKWDYEANPCLGDEIKVLEMERL